MGNIVNFILVLILVSVVITASLPIPDEEHYFDKEVCTIYNLYVFQLNISNISLITNFS